MTPEELATARFAHRMTDNATLCCREDGQKWPCDFAKVAAHLDAITAAVEEMDAVEGRTPDYYDAVGHLRAILQGRDPA